MIFANRQEGGKKIAQNLKKYSGRKAIVLALPRGGIVTGFEVAQSLGLPLDLVVPRKIGAPDNPEFAIGAITEDGNQVIDQKLLSSYGVSQEYLQAEIEKEKKEAKRRLKLYRKGRKPLDLKNKIAIIVDDGIATGSTMIAAIKAVKEKKAQKIIVAVPVTSRSALKKIEKMVDEVVYLEAPFFFGAVGAFYQEFGQTEDKEVVDLMQKAEVFNNN
jgi:putative phosphoribosyl transferase